MKPTEGPLTPLGAREALVTAHRDGEAGNRADWLAEEVPVALVFNGVSHAVMLASPLDLEDFALGFGLTEGLLAHPGELFGTEAVETPEGIELRLEVASACAWRLRERRRNLAGRTGCGLCGTDSLARVRQHLPALTASRLCAAALVRAQAALRASQGLQRLTGAVHAAAWCAPDGGIRLVREDVGRHNALDKLVGAMVRPERTGGGALEIAQQRDGFVLVTSRASFEMVQKTARAGVAALAAVSAPTALAVETAASCGMLLAGFVRDDGLVAYTHPERLDFEESSRPRLDRPAPRGTLRSPVRSGASFITSPKEGRAHRG